MLLNPFSGGSMFGGSFSLFSLLFTAIFVAMFVLIIVQIVRGAKQWNKNNHSPVLTVDATVAAKRTNVSHSSHHTGPDSMTTTTSSTTYYVTFQVASGDRMELHVGGMEYGMIAEGDSGKLTFQGTRYLGFDRTTE